MKNQDITSQHNLISTELKYYNDLREREREREKEKKKKRIFITWCWTKFNSFFFDWFDFDAFWKQLVYILLNPAWIHPSIPVKKTSLVYITHRQTREGGLESFPFHFHTLNRTTMQEMSSLLSLFTASVANCFAAFCGSRIFRAMSTASWLVITCGSGGGLCMYYSSQ